MANTNLSKKQRFALGLAAQGARATDEPGWPVCQTRAYGRNTFNSLVRRGLVQVETVNGTERMIPTFAGYRALAA